MFLIARQQPYTRWRVNHKGLHSIILRMGIAVFRIDCVTEHKKI